MKVVVADYEFPNLKPEEDAMKDVASLEIGRAHV